MTPQHLLVNTLIRSDLRDIACRDALISVLFRNADPSESARALQDPRIGPIEFSIPCLANWEHLPKELDRLLYKSILAFGTEIGGDYQKIVAALRRWEPDIETKLPKDQVLKLQSQPKKELISGLIYALTKIRDPEENFVKWRDAFLEEFISVTGPSIFKYDRSLKESMDFIYRNSPVRALERLDNNSSEFSY